MPLLKRDIFDYHFGKRCFANLCKCIAGQLVRACCVNTFDCAVNGYVAGNLCKARYGVVVNVYSRLPCALQVFYIIQVCFVDAGDFFYNVFKRVVIIT